GVAGLERLELVHQPVVLGVRNGRLVEHVVAIVVAVDLIAQLRGALRGAGPRHDQDSPAARAWTGASSDCRRRATRCGVSSSPCWSVIAPSSRSASARAARISSSKAALSDNGPG